MGGIAETDVRPGASFLWPQQSTWGRTAEPIVVVRLSGGRVTWRYPDALPGDVHESPVGTFLGQVNLGALLGGEAA